MTGVVGSVGLRDQDPHLRLPAERARIRGDAARAPRPPAWATPCWSTPAPSPPRPCARRARRSARRAATNPDARIVVTGCAAQIDPAAFAAMPEVDLVLGNAEKLDGRAPTATSASARPRRVRVNDIMSVRETAGHLIDGHGRARARAFVEVQNGCDHRCTFCIIPYGRGNSRSVPMGAVVDQIRQLVENGYREVVLTGVDITSYGARPAGRADASASWSGRSSGTCRSCRACASPRSTRSRSTTTLLRRDRRGGAADAASASVAAARRRPDPQAHEAPAFCAPTRSASSTTVRAAAARHRLRRRPDRRLPDRGRGDVRAHRCRSSRRPG